MKKLILSLLSIAAILAITLPCYPEDEWLKTQPAGTTLINDIDATVGENNEALDRLLSTYTTIRLTYSSASAITASAGSVVCSNSDGSVRKMRLNTSSTSVTFADIDTGAEAGSTTYYVYGNCDADETTATFKISASSSAPTGLTSYRRLGSFYNNSSSNISSISDDAAPSASTPVSKTIGVVYQALTDGVVSASASTTTNTSTCSMSCLVGDSNPPTTEVSGYDSDSNNDTVPSGSCSFLVPKGSYYEVTVSNMPNNQIMYFTPNGS